MTWMLFMQIVFLSARYQTEGGALTTSDFTGPSSSDGDLAVENRKHIFVTKTTKNDQ